MRSLSFEDVRRFDCIPRTEDMQTDRQAGRQAVRQTDAMVRWANGQRESESVSRNNGDDETVSERMSDYNASVRGWDGDAME